MKLPRYHCIQTQTALSLPSVFLLAVLTACGGSSDPAPQSATEENPVSEAPEELVQQEATAEIPQPDLSQVEPAVMQAVEKAQEAVRSAPLSAATWGHLGQVFHAHDFLPDAIASYRRAADLEGADYRWPYLQALVQRIQQPEEALQAFEEAARLEPANNRRTNSTVYISFGDALLEQGDLEGARQRYAQALSRDPEAPFALLGQARLSLLRDDPEEALRQAQELTQRQPVFREAHTVMARAANRLGQEDLARHHQEVASSISSASSPKDPAYQQVVDAGESAVWASRRGSVHLRSGRFEEAELDFRRVLEAVPSAAAHANLGVALAAQDRMEEAVEEYRAALQLDPQDTRALGGLGQAMLQKQAFPTAEGFLTKAVEIDPLDVEAQLNLGLVLRQQGKLEESLTRLRKVIDLRPADIRGLNEAGKTLVATRQIEQAAEFWRRSLKVDPRQLEVSYNLAVGLASLSEHGEAIAVLREALRQAPDSSRLSLFLAWELAVAPDPALRNGRQAVILAKRVRTTYPQQANAADVLAAAHAEVGDFAAAAREASAAIGLLQPGQDPGPIEARRALYRRSEPYRLPAKRP